MQITHKTNSELLKSLAFLTFLMVFFKKKHECWWNEKFVFWRHFIKKLHNQLKVWSALDRAEFILQATEKPLILLMCISGTAPGAKLLQRDLNCYLEAFHDSTQKVYSPVFQLILLLLILAGLKLLSLDARPADRDYHSSSNSQRILNSLTWVRLKPSR